MLVHRTAKPISSVVDNVNASLCAGHEASKLDASLVTTADTLQMPLTACRVAWGMKTMR